MKETIQTMGKAGRKKATEGQSKYKKIYMLWLQTVLVEQRKNMGLNHRQMAEKLDIKRPSYSHIEAGRIAVSPEMLHRLAEVLGMEFYMGFREKESKKNISEFPNKDLDI